jgi:hypothetical protein
VKRRSKMGRPPKPETEKVNVPVTFKMKKATHESLKKLARDRGMSVSATVVALVEAAVTERKPVWSRRAKRRGHRRQARRLGEGGAVIDAVCSRIAAELSDFADKFQAAADDEQGDEKVHDERVARLYGEAADIVEALQRKLFELEMQEQRANLTGNGGVAEKLAGVAAALGLANREGS